MSAHVPSSLANEIVRKTSTEEDTIILVSGTNVMYARKGMYGGWLVSGKLGGADLALWCFKRDYEKLKLEDVAGIESVGRFIEEIKRQELPMPEVRRVVYYYRPVKVRVVKAADKYTVIDIEPEPVEVKAEAIHVYWWRHYSARGRCFGYLCNEERREKVRLTAKLFNLEIYEADVGRRDVEVRIKIVTNTKDLEDLLKPRAEPAQEVQEEVEAPSEEVEEEPKAIPQIEIKPKELEVELETAPTPTTAVPTAVVPERSELVKVYLLAMRLPSKYLLQKIEVNEDSEGSVEVRKWSKEAVEVASRLEGIRRSAYTKLERVFAHVEEYGVWVAVTEKAVEEARKVNEWVREELKKETVRKALEAKNIDVDKLYSVRAIPVYLEPENAKELLEAAIRHLSEDAEELSRRIAEAEQEQSKRALKRLSEDLEYKKALLESFKKFLSQL